MHLNLRLAGRRMSDEEDFIQTFSTIWPYSFNLLVMRILLLKEAPNQRRCID
jgi:hypothetical protein